MAACLCDLACSSVLGRPLIISAASSSPPHPPPQEERVAYDERMRKIQASEKARLELLKEDPELPLVYMDVVLHGGTPGRIEMVLFPKESPLATENMRLMLSGETSVDDSGKSCTLRGAYFYRILNRFITQVRGQAAAEVPVLARMPPQRFFPYERRFFPVVDGGPSRFVVRPCSHMCFVNMAVNCKT